MQTELVGHRGCGAQYPENTLYAVKETAEHLDRVEIDIRRCGSGELVVFHDRTVDRVTGGSGPVAEHTLAELKELCVGDSDEQIPTLGELVAALPAGLALQVELKETGTAGDAVELLEPVADRVRFSSFLPAALAGLRDVAPDSRRGLLFSDDPAANLQTAADLGCSAAHPSVELCADTDVVERARERGFDVIAFGGTTETAVRRAIQAGVDGVTTDHWRWG